MVYQIPNILTIIQSHFDENYTGQNIHTHNSRVQGYSKAYPHTWLKTFALVRKLYLEETNPNNLLAQESISLFDSVPSNSRNSKLIFLKRGFDPTNSLQCQKDQGWKIKEVQRQEMTFSIKASQEQKPDLTQIGPMFIT